MADCRSQERELKAAIMFLSYHLAKEWRDIARLLGLTDAEIHIINYDYHGDTKEKTYRMLVKWTEKNGDLATFWALTSALRKVGRLDLAHALSEGDHLTNFLDIQDVATPLKAVNKDRNNMMKDTERHEPKRKWILIIVCIVGPVAIAYLIYPVISNHLISKNNAAAEEKASPHCEEDKREKEASSAIHSVDDRKGYWDKPKKSEYGTMEPDQLENAVMDVKNSLTSEWQEVGRFLGLSHPDIEHIKEEYANNPKERNYQMLQKWREQYGKQATLEVLEDALRKAGRRDSADSLP